MKRRLSSAVILTTLWVLTVVGGITIHYTINAGARQAHTLINDMKHVQQLVVTRNWPDASKNMQDVLTSWEKLRRRFAYTTDHAEMDVVTDFIIDAEAKIETEDDGAFAVLHQAIDRIKTLPERDRLMMENLF